MRPVPDGAQSVTDVPWQIEAPHPVMAQEGADVNVTVFLQKLLHPLEFVTVTEYVPAALTVIQLVVAPVLHK